MQRICIKEGRERRVLGGHPWIFSGAIERAETAADAGPVADVFDYQSRWLARGLFNPKSQIRVRVLTPEKEEIDAALFFRRIAEAAALRERLGFPPPHSYPPRQRRSAL